MSNQSDSLNSELELWPLKYARTNIGRLSNGEKSLKYAVLVSTGAINPIHRGHLQMLTAAKV
jgi:hypothetical protein